MDRSLLDQWVNACVISLAMCCQISHHWGVPSYIPLSKRASACCPSGSAPGQPTLQSDMKKHNVLVTEYGWHGTWWVASHIMQNIFWTFLFCLLLWYLPKKFLICFWPSIFPIILSFTSFSLKGLLHTAFRFTYQRGGLDLGAAWFTEHRCHRGTLRHLSVLFSLLLGDILSRHRAPGVRNRSTCFLMYKSTWAF